MNKQEPFPSVLDAIFNSERVPIHLLYRLSDMTSDEYEHFKTAWPAVDDERRSVIVRHMADIAEDSYLVDFSPVFTFLLSDPSAQVRLAALDGVWDSTDHRLIKPIMEMMRRDPAVPVRASAARALSHFVLLSEWGQIGARYAAPIVEALLAEYDKPTTAVEVRRAALEAMASANHPRIAECIDEAYETGSFEMQLSAIFAMGSTADNRWLPVLFDEMGSPSAEMRAEAARACGSIGDAEAIANLTDLLSDEDGDVVEAVIVALGQIGGEEAFNILSELAEDSDFSDLHDVIDEVLEEMDWTTGQLDLLSFTVQEDEEDDPRFSVN